MSSSLLLIITNYFEPIAISYDEHGNIKGKAEIKPPTPIRLDWDFNDPQLVKMIDEAFIDSQKVINVSLTVQRLSKIF